MGYEYKEITADSSRISLLIDGYESFGWELDEKFSDRGISGTSPLGKSARQMVTVHLRRNRKIVNKMELTRLQRNFEACVGEIEELEKARTSGALMAAILLEILGTALIAGSTFAVTARPPQYIFCIVLAMPGFLGWIFSCFLYKRIVRKDTERVVPLIEAKYDEIYEFCEKGSKLVFRDMEG